MAESMVLGYKLAPMRKTTLLALPIVALLAACSEADVPNGVLFFTSGQDTTTFDGVDHFTLERIDSSGKSKRLFKKDELPETYDMGTTGTYRFRATAFDAEENALARGETLQQDVSTMGALEVPIFLSRTDRTTLADDNFAVAPGEHPKVELIGTSALWLWANPSSDYITTDGYNYAYWQQVDPIGSSVDFSELECPSTPCVWQTLVLVGGYVAVAISDEWAFWVDEYHETSNDYDLPEGLGSFANVAGGRVMRGASGTAFLLGGARVGEPTNFNLSFANTGLSTVIMSNTPRAGAASLFETDVGLVLVGGSATGTGVERIASGGTEFTALNYPPDAVTGAALVREDATHVLRVGGKNADGITPAETVRIDIACALEACAAESLPELSVALNGAQSYWDPESGDSIIVGETDEGLTSVYRYGTASGIGVLTPIEIPTDQARLHASAIELPNRKVALIGGMDPSRPTSSRSIISVVSF
jgi:hypothetical protein